jgi:hypothetical protein
MLRWTPRKVIHPDELHPKTRKHLAWILAYEFRNWNYAERKDIKGWLYNVVHPHQRDWWTAEIEGLHRKYRERLQRRDIGTYSKPMPVRDWIGMLRTKELHAAVKSFVCRRCCTVETSIFGSMNQNKAIWFNYSEPREYLCLTIPNTYRIVSQESFLGMFKPYQRVLLFQTRYEYQPMFWLTKGRGKKIHFHTGYYQKGELIEVPALPKLMPDLFHVNQEGVEP